MLCCVKFAIQRSVSITYFKEYCFIFEISILITKTRSNYIFSFIRNPEMSSKHEVNRRCDRSRSRSMERKREHRVYSRSKDHRKQSISPVSKHRSGIRQKHRSSSREGNHSSKHKKSKKKKKKKRNSSSSDSSSSDEEELKLLQRLEAERERLKEERRKEKERMKANETPEEKRARRLREKQEKERKRRERMGWDGEYQCYTNQDNPFGDSALTNTFVWKAKLAKEGVKNVSRDEIEAQNRQKQMENKVELEKVKQRRLEREAERAAREAEAAAMTRARETQQFHSWARQEDAFHLQQARLRSQIRIRDGRAKPIDLLAWYVHSEQCVDALEMHEPYTYLNGLQAQDLEDLLEDIKVYKELEENANHGYWEDVQTIVLDEVNKLRRLAAPGARRDTVHRAVVDDVTQIFKGKTGSQLEALQTQIEEKINGRQDGIDIGYWESLLSQLKAHMARARLRDRHQLNLRRKLELLKQEQGVAAAAPQEGQAQEQQPEGSGETKEEPSDGKRSRSPSPSASRPASPSPSADDEEELEAQCVSLYRNGRYSPVPLSPRCLEPGTILADETLDEQRLCYLRERLHAANASSQHAANASSQHAASLPAPLSSEPGTSSSAGPALGAAPEDALERSARAAMGAGEGEAQFSVEYALEKPALWPDKYRPRKPRYFNRVHTGFEWNKYNQTHYDMDNPPPKIVQGYKFNIFYPDLIDPQSTPEFSLKPCPENAEFAVLRFHAGPPYEDIAFKIVNREWEYSYKRGFRCHFHNNIFQLWFHFKRYRYRR